MKRMMEGKRSRLAKKLIIGHKSPSSISPSLLIKLFCSDGLPGNRKHFQFNIRGELTLHGGLTHRDSNASDAIRKRRMGRKTNPASLSFGGFGIFYDRINVNLSRREV